MDMPARSRAIKLGNAALPSTEKNGSGIFLIFIHSFFFLLKISNEPELVRRLQQGDVHAFDSLYHTYQHALYANIRKLTRDHAISEDILQETFIALWENRSSLDPEQGVAGWLFVVSYNKSVAQLRKLLKQSCISLSDGVEIGEEEEPASLAEIQSLLLQRAIEQLSPQKRKVFELCKIQGKSYEETARELQISKHTVKEYLVLSIENIRTFVRQHPEYQAMSLHATLLTIMLAG